MRHRGRGRLRRQGPRFNQPGRRDRRACDAIPGLAVVNARGYSDALILT